jgi:hypothetical protein
MGENERRSQIIKEDFCFICSAGVSSEKRALLWSGGIVTTLGINLSKHVDVPMSDVGEELMGDIFCCIPCKRKLLTIVSKVESLRLQFKLAHKKNYAGDKRALQESGNGASPVRKKIAIQVLIIQKQKLHICFIHA